MNILKFKDGYIGNPRLVYCGRPSKDEYYCEQLLIGLGNPYSWRNSKKAKFKVNSLAESLSEYRKWLWKLICSCKDRNLDQLLSWEFRYWQLMKHLAIAIAKGNIDGLVCFCRDIQNYVPVKGQEKCHTQILYSACLYLIDSGLVDINDESEIDLASLW